MEVPKKIIGQKSTIPDTLIPLVPDCPPEEYSDVEEQDDSEVEEQEEKEEKVPAIVHHTMIPQVDQSNIVFRVDFSDGYTLRQLFEFFRMSLPCAPLFLHEKGITIERGNGSDTLFVRANINRMDLVDYKLNMDLVNDPKNRRHIVNFELNEFQVQMKSIAKKEGILLVQYPQFSDCPGTVHGQAYGGNKNSAGSILFRTQKYEDVKYEIDDGITNETIPNAVIPLPAFFNACSNLSRVKHPFALMSVYPNGVRLDANNESGSTGRGNIWGDCSGFVNKKVVEPYKTCIPLHIIKTLVKTANFHSAGIVRVYGTSNQLVRLEIPVGCYANVMILLRGRDPSDFSGGKKKRQRGR